MKSVSFADHIEVIRYYRPSDPPAIIDSNTHYIKDIPNVLNGSVYAHSYQWYIFQSNSLYSLENLHSSHIQLEGLSILHNTLYGHVKVTNLALDKVIRIHATTDNWKSKLIVPCHYLHSDISSNIDTFQFSLPLDNCNELLPTKLLSFALEYCVNNTVYWDNNNHSNYQIHLQNRTRATPVVSGRRVQIRSTSNLPSLSKSDLARIGRKSSFFMSNFNDWSLKQPLLNLSKSIPNLAL
ncbi:putative phosphatase regulatory subunit-domain-containing protein [Globomyces pollinis-pini]|nr:putative phosphatase regulatory subunit-domain-containing protein [Globomyces pollinis-pini]